MNLTYLDDLWEFLGRHDCSEEANGIVRGYLDLAAIDLGVDRVMKAYRVATDKGCLLEDLKLAAGENEKEAKFYLSYVIWNHSLQGTYKEIFGHEPGPEDGEIGRTLARDTLRPKKQT